MSVWISRPYIFAFFRMALGYMLKRPAFSVEDLALSLDAAGCC